MASKLLAMASNLVEAKTGFQIAQLCEPSNTGRLVPASADTAGAGAAAGAAGAGAAGSWKQLAHVGRHLRLCQE